MCGGEASQIWLENRSTEVGSTKLAAVEVVQQQEGIEVRIARLGRGKSFGELALLGDRMRAATVRAVTDTTALSIARADFGALVEQVPALRGAWQREARTPEDGR